VSSVVIVHHQQKQLQQLQQQQQLLLISTLRVAGCYLLFAQADGWSPWPPLQIFELSILFRVSVSQLARWFASGVF